MCRILRQFSTRKLRAGPRATKLAFGRKAPAPVYTETERTWLACQTFALTVPGPASRTLAPWLTTEDGSAARLKAMVKLGVRTRPHAHDFDATLSKDARYHVCLCGEFQSVAVAA